MTKTECTQPDELGFTPAILKSILVFGGFITQNAADGFDDTRGPERINYLARLINAAFEEQGQP